MMNRRRFLSEAAALAAAQSTFSGSGLPRAGNPYIGLDVAKAKSLEERNLTKYTQEIDALIAAGPFRPDWDSLHEHKDAEWFRDAKFGIYTHWGPVTVGSSFSPGDAEWYGNQMYKPDHPAFDYHRRTFGDQHSAGYKDIIPRFTGERFNPEQWAVIVKQSGARFAGPVAIHHDNFAMWNSSLTRWNSVAMGPHRDVVGELAAAYRRNGLRFITSFHHGFAWRYYEPSFAYDGANPEYDDLYTQVHAPKAPPSRHFQDRWAAEVYEVLEKYQPDLIYFDFEFYEVITPKYQKRLFAMAYDWAARNHREISVTQKSRAIHEHTGILDFERGRADTITPYPWLTDTATGPWFYVAAEKLRTAEYFIGVLADIVSKNGCMMLDVGPQVDGTFPQPSVDILVKIGRWLRINGEAIYGTRPWTTYGEGPTHNPAGASFSESKDQPYTSRDVRYTTKRNALYAIVLGRPQGTIHLSSVNPAKLWFGAVKSIEVLGSQEKVAWSPSGDGIALDIPAAALPNVGESWVLKITGK